MLSGWLAGWLAGRLAGWLAGLSHLTPESPKGDGGRHEGDVRVRGVGVVDEGHGGGA